MQNYKSLSYIFIIRDWLGFIFVAKLLTVGIHLPFILDNNYAGVSMRRGIFYFSRLMWIFNIPDLRLEYFSSNKRTSNEYRVISRGMY